MKKKCSELTYLENTIISELVLVVSLSFNPNYTFHLQISVSLMVCSISTIRVSVLAKH